MWVIRKETHRASPDERLHVSLVLQRASATCQRLNSFVQGRLGPRFWIRVVSPADAYGVCAELQGSPPWIHREGVSDGQKGGPAQCRLGAGAPRMLIRSRLPPLQRKGRLGVGRSEVQQRFAVDGVGLDERESARNGPHPVRGVCHDNILAPPPTRDEDIASVHDNALVEHIKPRQLWKLERRVQICCHRLGQLHKKLILAAPKHGDTLQPREMR
eukprot:3977226-Prymnesium_polylepis.1